MAAVLPFAPLTAVPASGATPPAATLDTWANQFPSPARVNRDVAADAKEGEELDIAARQRGTLYQLYDGLSKLSGTLITDPGGTQLRGNANLPDSVRQKRRAYWDAVIANQDTWYPRLGSPCGETPRTVCKRARYLDTSANLQFSRAYAREIAARYFKSPQLRAQYVETVTRLPASVPKPPEEEIVWDLRSTLIFLLIAGAGFAVIIMVVRRDRGSVSRGASDTHGSARFADPCKAVSEDAPFKGVFLGKSSHPDLDAQSVITMETAPVYTVPESHTLILARAGTGKGSRVIVPTLLRYDQSMIVIDPKGENAAMTARIRKTTLGQAVHILNPWGELAAEFVARGFPFAARFNPLDVLDRNDPNVVAIAQNLARAVCGTAQGKDSFWKGNATSLLAAVFLWLADEPGEKKTLERARQIVTMSRRELERDYLSRMKASRAFEGAISEMVSSFIGMADETYSGIVSNLTESTRFISDMRIKYSTAESTFAIRDLIDARTTIYIVFPTDRMDEASTWLRLILSAVTHTFKRTPRPDNQRCMFLIDEFPALGRIDDMPRDIAVMRGYGLDFTLVVQGIDQLRDHYKEAHRTIINNCGYKWFCNVSDPDTAKYLSEALGKKTIATTSQSISSSPRGGSSSVSHGETGRELMTPDEILNLGRDVAIVLNPEDRPFYLRTIDYWNLSKAFQHLHGKNRLSAYYRPPIEYDNNPYHKPEAQQAQPPAQTAAQPLRTPPQPSPVDPATSQAKPERQRVVIDWQRASATITTKEALDTLGLSEKDVLSRESIEAAYKQRSKVASEPRLGGNWAAYVRVRAARDHLLEKQPGPKPGDGRAAP